MKKLFASIMLVAFVTTAWAQSQVVEDFQNKYKDDRDAKVVAINGGLFKILSGIASYGEDEEALAFSRISDNIKSMNILSIPLYKSGFDPDEIDEMRSNLEKDDYDELMTIRDGGDRIYIMAQGAKNEVRNMLVLIREEKEFVLMNIDGTLDMKDLAILAKNHKDWN